MCVCVETPLVAESDTAFLNQAVDFANGELWGTLAASITLPADSARTQPAKPRCNRPFAASITARSPSISGQGWLCHDVSRLGRRCRQQLDDAQSGIGWVHNSSMLEGVEKNVLTGPLTVSPKPMWFATHSNPEAVAWRLLNLYDKPSLWKLAALLGSAVRHGR